MSSTRNFKKIWPPECDDEYEKKRLIGVGAFGDVWLAKPRKGDESLVALKILDASTRMAYNYAERETAILREMDHQNCIKLVRAFKCDVNYHCYVIVITYAEGPTLYDLIRHGGALGLAFCNTITRQLLEVVSYLHSRGVIHRDLKPDNCIVRGADFSHDDIWSVDDDDKCSNKWKLTLIDFGFARAISSSELQGEEGRTDDETSKKIVSTASLNLPYDPNSSVHKNKNFVSNIFSKELEMSSIGCRAYAAPEIIQGTHSNKKWNSKFNKLLSSSSHHKEVAPKTLSPYVSEYNMKCDSFSLGCILRYMFTGVPPGENIPEYISFQKNPLILLIKSLLACRKKSSERRKLQFRFMSDLPKDISALICNLTEQDEHRITVRNALKRYIFSKGEDESSIKIPLDDIHFLECTKTQGNIIPV